MRSMEESHAQAAEQLDHLFERKLEHEGDRFVSLEAKLLELQDHMKDLRETGKQKLAEEARAFGEELARRTAEKDMEITKHKDLIAFTEHRFQAMLDQESQEYEGEIAET